MATSAEADYVARGLQETIRGCLTSTREVQVQVRNNVTSRTKNINTSNTLADGSQKRD